MQRKAIATLIVLVVIYLGLCAALFFFQRSLIYFPQPRQFAAAPTRTLAADGAQVLVTTRLRDGPNAVVYFGGNAEDVSYSLYTLAEAFPAHSLYLMHYRGYGGSSGSPSEAALIADATVLFDEVLRAHKNITVVGRSLGSGVAVHLASQRPVARLVLVTPYNSIQELAAQQFPYFPVRWLLQDKFESWRYAEQISAPTLLLAAEHDEVIPSASTQALQTHFPMGVATLKVVRGTGHNTISESPSYVQVLRGAP
ncbi:MAG: alpha/beta fold hydrolase [Rhodoferax sp.]|nr:alpha/beta fold hydrolase [Rhodoferax sp.]